MRLVDRLRRMVVKAGNHIGYVKFIKRNGELREMWFKSKIPQTKLKGGSLPYDKREKQIEIVYDIEKKEVRAIRLDSIVTLSVNGMRYNHG